MNSLQFVALINVYLQVLAPMPMR